MPHMLWSYDEGEEGWVALVFEDLEARHPEEPWSASELDRVIDAMAQMAALLTPYPLPPGTVATAKKELDERHGAWRQLRDEEPSRLHRLDKWSVRHLEALVGLEATAGAAAGGDTLLHFDLRADNTLLDDEGVWFVDRPLACVGAAWVDPVLFAPSVTMQGGPPREEVIVRHPACRTAEEGELAAVIAVWQDTSLTGRYNRRHRGCQPCARSSRRRASWREGGWSSGPAGTEPQTQNPEPCPPPLTPPAVGTGPTAGPPRRPRRPRSPWPRPPFGR